MLTILWVGLALFRLWVSRKGLRHIIRPLSRLVPSVLVVNKLVRAVAKAPTLVARVTLYLPHLCPSIPVLRGLQMTMAPHLPSIPV